MNNETKRIIIEEGYFTEVDYPFGIKPKFSTLVSNLELSTKRAVIIFVPVDNIRDLERFKKTTKYEECNLSTSPVDILSFDNVIIECDVAHGIIYRGERSVIFQIVTKDVDLGYKSIEKIRGGVQWYMMESNDIISSIWYKLKNENSQLVSFNGQSITFRLSIKEI